MNMKAKGLDKFFDLDKIEEIVDDVDAIVDIPAVVVSEDSGDDENLPAPIVEDIVSNEKQEVLTDSSFIRDRLKSMLQKAELALTIAISAQEEEEGRPRNTEAISNMMDTMNKTLKELVSLNKTEAELSIKRGGSISKDNAVSSSTNITNQTVVLTSEEAIKLVVDQMKGATPNK